MLFNSLQFWLFFAVVYLAYRVASPGSRNRILLIASLVFYFVWIPVYILLLLANLGVNYVLMRRMLRSAQPRRYLAASIALSLSVLAWFKYAAFGITSINVVLSPFGTFIPAPHILLPLGISFYTFQMIALQVDAYRKRVEPPDSFHEFLLFVSFFPQLIAGPILRGRQFLPQLRRGGLITTDRNRRGVRLVVLGLTKKILFADVLLAPYVDRVYAFPGLASGPEHLLAVYSFAFQIYCDFSGYTDIARGIALLLGFELPLNFREPYLSRNPSEFWRRWHITLSEWLRDYLYIPLGGNRRGSLRTHGNLALTMLLGGLWHGAGWNFLIWGGLHGLLLSIHRLLRNPARDEGERMDSWPDWLSAFLLFQVVCILWVFFRSPTFVDAITILRGLFDRWSWGAVPVMQCLVVLVSVLFHIAERPLRVHSGDLLVRTSANLGGVLEGAVLGALLGLILLFGGSGGEFIYFQF